MKKMLLAVLLLCAGMASAENTHIERSSFTLTSDTAYIQASNLVGVVIGAASTGGSLHIYNSTWTTNSVLISSISLTNPNTHTFGSYGVSVKGIYYRIFTNVGGVTIIYKK